MVIKGFVLAGDFREYVIWLQENEKNRSEYPYIGDEDGIQTMRDQSIYLPVYLVGTYRDHMMLYDFVKRRFQDIRRDTLPLGFNADPDKHREKEETATSEDTYHE